MVFPTRIYLTGFMGSGKSTIGPLLAERIGYEFIDLDAAIEASAGTSIPHIFSEQGEDEFRRLEALKLRSVSRAMHVVIALGGGAVVSEDNLYFVVTNGTLVYLDVQPEVLAQRLLAGRDGRPMLMGANGQALDEVDLVERVQSLVAARKPFYTRADVAVDVGAMGVDETVEAIVDALMC